MCVLEFCLGRFAPDPNQKIMLKVDPKLGTLLTKNEIFKPKTEVKENYSLFAYNYVKESTQ